jgi:heme oxygenase (biliverdin-IX-beta and delta-forming)
MYKGEGCRRREYELLGARPDVPANSELLLRLDVETRHHHGAVDAPWRELLRPTVTSADYLSVLVRTYGFIGPLEAACKYTPDVEHLLEPVQYTRAGLVAQDLLALGLSPAQLARVPQCHAIASFRGAAEALGWLYLVERSLLLHAELRHHLVQHVQGVEHALAYLSGSEADAIEHWARFGRLLDRVAERPDVANEIVLAAHAGFDTLAAWFRTES